MPIQSIHPQYESYAKKWQRARDASTGQDAIHAGMESYLPKLAEQSDIEYRKMVARSTYFNATGRTIDGMVGMVFRKAPEIVGNGIDGILADIDLQGNSFSSFAQTLIRELLTVERYGVLVEYPNTSTEGMTQAQVSAMNLRPYASVYKTESIINWRYARVNNVMQSVMVILHEIAYDNTDIYEPKPIEQIRELLLTDVGYIQRIYQKQGNNDYLQIGDDIIPLLNGKPLTFIPFYAFGSDENTLKITDAPILPLVDLNIAHYQVNADYRHGTHLSGLPTLLIAGVELGESQKIYVGSETAIVSPTPEAHGEYIEVKGDFGALKDSLLSLERQMAALGSRILENQKSGVEAVETMKLRANGETSVLAAMCNLASDQLSKMLTLMAQWSGINSEITIKLNTDYNPVGLTAQELAELVKSWQAGAISYDTLFKALKRGEIIADATIMEDEQELISNGQAPLAE